MSFISERVADVESRSQFLHVSVLVVCEAVITLGSFLSFFPDMPYMLCKSN